MTLIETEGQNTEPELVDSIQTFAHRLAQIHLSHGNLQMPNENGQHYFFVMSGLIDCNTKLSSLPLYSMNQAVDNYCEFLSLERNHDCLTQFQGHDTCFAPK